jgi:hypothetical protein
MNVVTLLNIHDKLKRFRTSVYMVYGICYLIYIPFCKLLSSLQSSYSDQLSEFDVYDDVQQLT